MPRPKKLTPQQLVNSIVQLDPEGQQEAWRLLRQEEGPWREEIGAHFERFREVHFQDLGVLHQLRGKVRKAKRKTTASAALDADIAKLDRETDLKDAVKAKRVGIGLDAIRKRRSRAKKNRQA